MKEFKEIYKELCAPKKKRPELDTYLEILYNGEYFKIKIYDNKINVESKEFKEWHDGYITDSSAIKQPEILENLSQICCLVREIIEKKINEELSLPAEQIKQLEEEFPNSGAWKKELETKTKGWTKNKSTNWEKKEVMLDTIKKVVTIINPNYIPVKGKITDPDEAKAIADGQITNDLMKEGILKFEKKKIKKVIDIYYGKRDLARRILDIQPMYYDKAKIWWMWNPEEFRWVIIDECEIKKLVGDMSSANTVDGKEKTEILEALQQESRGMKPKDIKPTWIQFKNAIYDIKTGETYIATPEYFVTNPLPFNLHPEWYIETPVMDKIFEEWVGKEHVRTLYEIISYCMLPDYPINIIFCFVGAGMNGKSCFLNLLRKFLGEYNCTSTELEILINRSFEVTKLYKKLICMMGETNFTEFSKTSILKKLSGGDLVGFEYKNKTPFDDKNYAKILIATNNIPTTTDKSIGFYRRWMIIDFPNQFSEKKDILAEIPEEEFQCLAVKCCYILKELLEQRKFTNQGSIEERIARYEAKSNFLAHFIKLYTTDEDPNGYITSAELHRKFSDWCKENRHRQMSETSFGMEMKKLGYENIKRYFDWMYDGKGGQARVWSGLKWKE